METLNRRRMLAMVAGLTGLPAWPGADGWPQRAVRVVSPLAPGGPNDLSARVIGRRLQERLAVPFVVENRPGAGTRIGNAAVAHAPADGTTLLYAAAALSILPGLYEHLQYDWRVELAPITLAVKAPLFLVVGEQCPARDVHELVGLARERTGRGLDLACPGIGTVPHLLTELLCQRLPIRGQAVQFNGDLAVTVELLAGRVDAAFAALTSVLAHVRRGTLRILAVAATERSALFDAAPTLLEEGIREVSGHSWFGFLAPAMTAAHVIHRAHDAITGVLAEPQVVGELAAAGLQVAANTPSEFHAFIDAEARKWAAVIKAGNIKAE